MKIITKDNIKNRHPYKFRDTRIIIKASNINPDEELRHGMPCSWDWPK